MSRVLSACVVLLVAAGVGGPAWAGGKPPIAILGLEVYDNGGGIDPETTRAAKDLTAALRDRAKAGTGPYAPVQGGEKELIDEKLLNNCDSEAPTCMAAIGTELGAEVLMYGRIEKASQNGQGIYRVSLKLLNVGRKQLASSTVESLPVGDSNGPRASTHAKVWYAKHAGVVAGGALAIRANIDRGTVLVDDETKGNLASGALTLTGLPEGRHTLAIEAQGYQRYEASVTVRNGETTPQNVTLVEMSRKASVAPRDTRAAPISREGTVSTRSGSNLWKPVFYSTAVLEAGAIGFAFYEWQQERNEAGKIKAMTADGRTVTEADCGKFDDAALKNACTAHDRHIIGVVVSSVLGAAVIGSFYMAFIRDNGGSETKSAVRGHHKRRQFAVTPIVTPEGGGATLRFDW